MFIMGEWLTPCPWFYPIGKYCLSIEGAPCPDEEPIMPEDCFFLTFFEG